MCTVTWVETPDGYELFHGRDERRARGRGVPPRERDAGGLRALAPRDADAGGTWVGANERAVALAVLNGWPEPGSGAERFASRGLLVDELLACSSLADVARRLAAAELAAYRPFRLLALAPDGAALHAWDGAALASRPARAADAPLVSAPADPRGPAAAERARARLLAQLERERDGARDADLLARFHASHAGPVCTHGTESSTVSLTRVRVDRAHVALAYADGPPCRTALRPAGALERRG